MDATSAPAAAAVSALMQQLKSGDISKMQLFQQLAKLQSQQPPPVALFGTSTLPPTPSFVPNQPPPPPSASFAYGASAYASTAPRTTYSASAVATHSPSMPQPTGAKVVQGGAEFLATGVSHDKVPSFSVKEWMASKSRAASSVSQPPPSASAVQALFGHDTALSDPPTGSQPSASPHTASDAASPYVYTPQRHSGGDADSPAALFTLDRPGAEFIDFSEHFREDLVPASMRAKGGDGGAATNIGGGGGGGADEAKFHARVTRWQSQKEAEREQMKQQLLQSELRECTFAPRVNAKSTKVVAKLRGRQLAAGDDAAAATRCSPLAVSERLYQEADGYKAREELAARVKAEEEAEMARECTFRPRINRASALTDRVRAKYLDPAPETSPSLAAAAMEAAARELRECTFQPKVNPIGSDMASAQLYLRQDIYERLSRPCADRRTRSELGDDASDTGSDACRPRSVAGCGLRAQDDLYVRSEGGRRPRLTRRSSQPRPRERPRSAGGEQTAEDEAARASRFESFLERQKFHEQARAKRIEQTKQQLAPGHKPSINKASLQMMGDGRKGDFLERITKYALRKQHDAVKSKTVRVSDPHCTFKPSINQASAKRKARSVTELSRGDLLRRETSQRLMKLKMEQEEMAALTFRPQLSRVSERHESRLKILSSPDTYLQRIQQQSQAHAIRQRRALQEKELDEFAECTFKPRTIEAPAYVQRIARSVSLTKALREQRQAAAKASDKPEWK